MRYLAFAETYYIEEATSVTHAIEICQLARGKEQPYVLAIGSDDLVQESWSVGADGGIAISTDFVGDDVDMLDGGDC